MAIKGNIQLLTSLHGPGLMAGEARIEVTGELIGSPRKMAEFHDLISEWLDRQEDGVERNNRRAQQEQS